MLAWLGCASRDPEDKPEHVLHTGELSHRDKRGAADSMGRVVLGCCTTRDSRRTRVPKSPMTMHVAMANDPEFPAPGADTQPFHYGILSLWDTLAGEEPEFFDDTGSDAGDSVHEFHDALSDHPLHDRIPPPRGQVEDPWSEPVPSFILNELKPKCQDMEPLSKVKLVHALVFKRFEGRMTTIQERHWTLANVARSFMGHNFSVDETIEAFMQALHHVEQRSALFTSRKLSQPVAPCDFRIVGRDNEGHPICYGCAGNQVIPIHQLADHFLVVMHAAVELCFGEADQMVMIFDFAGFGFSHVTTCAMGSMQEFGQVMSACFPERMSKIVCVDLPRVASILYDAAKPMISERTKAKMAFPTMVEMEDLLLEFCEADAVAPLLQSMRQNRTSMSVDARRPMWTCWGRGTPCSVYDINSQFVGLPDFDA
mmetsp:Transcript_22617/g.49547  ORF Transcript_22617/g.49547 Transcript_22617/m.49547 type:complete len:426 (-) Transcript_22617:191-1468(-)